jgi:hypothetical protein
MPTTESEEVEIENVVRLDSFERDILNSGAPIFAEVQTTEGTAIAVFMLSCTWNSDTADEIQRERHMPGDVIFSTRVNNSRRKTYVYYDRRE